MQPQSPTSSKSIVMTHDACSWYALNLSKVSHFPTAVCGWQLRGGNEEDWTRIFNNFLILRRPLVHCGPPLQWYGGHSREMLTVNRTGTSFYRPVSYHLPDSGKNWPTGNLSWNVKSCLMVLFVASIALLVDDQPGAASSYHAEFLFIHCSLKYLTKFFIRESPFVCLRHLWRKRCNFLSNVAVMDKQCNSWDKNTFFSNKNLSRFYYLYFIFWKGLNNLVFL